MGQKERVPLLDIRINRRDLITNAAVASGYLAYRDSKQDLSDLISGDTAHYVDAAIYSRDYSLLESDDELYSSIFTPEKYSVISPENLESGNGELLFKGEFTTTGINTPVDLGIKSQAEDSIQFHPLLVKANGLNLFLPFVTSLQETDIATQLGEFEEPGKHGFEIYQVDGFPPLDPYSLDLEIRIPQGTSIQEALRKTSPMYAIRPNNLKDFEEYITNEPFYRKLQRWMGKTDMRNIATDAPMLAYNKFSKNEKQNTIRRDTVIIFKSEKKGKPAFTRLQEYGRTEDVEWAMRDIFKISDFERVKGYDQRSNHRPAESDSSFWYEHPRQQIKTDNNNFDVDIETNIFFFPPSLTLPGMLHSKELIEANPALRYLAFMEESEKSPEMGLADGKDLADKILEKMRIEGASVYPAIPQIVR